MMCMQMTSALTSVRHVNKTDVLTLGTSFGVCSAAYSYFVLYLLTYDVKLKLILLTLTYVILIRAECGWDTGYFNGRFGSLPRNW
jgi:hypothetical protein